MGIGEPGSLVGVVLARTKEPTCALAVPTLYLPRSGRLSSLGPPPCGRKTLQTHSASDAGDHRLPPGDAGYLSEASA